MSEPVNKIDLTRKYTVSEWMQIIQTSETKYEYVDGYLIDIRAMAGGTMDHSSIGLNTASELHIALKGKPCRPFNSDLAVRGRQMARYRYPDISVVCTDPEFSKDDERKLVLLNPTLVIEVLSDTTEGSDRGEKFSDYRAIESLKEYVLISQHKPMIETYTRNTDGTWTFRFWTGVEAVAKLESIDISLKLADVYVGVKFPE